jgi:type II secretory pathway pseudopilin PulG
MRREEGFTIVELLVVIILSALVSTAIISFTFHYWRHGSLLEADLETLNTRLDAGDTLRDSVGVSTGLIMQNSISDSNVEVPDPSSGSGYWLTIHAIPGNIPMPSSGTKTPLLYYKRPSLSSSGGYIMNGTQPYEDEYILYMDGSTNSLMQRTLVNPDASGNRTKTSCPVSSATSSCPADKTIAEDVSSIDMRYFSRVGNLLDYTSIYDTTTNSYAGPDFTAVEVVEFTINITRKAFLQTSSTTKNSTIIRIALRNS